MSKNINMSTIADSNNPVIAENPIDSADFIEIPNDKTTDNGHSGKGRKLSAKNSTFCIAEGSYKGTITDAFWYKTAADRERVMFVFALEDGTEFKNSVDGEWVDNYPFSELILQTNIEYVKNFKGLKVNFTVRNTKGDTMTFSNIKKISLDE